jgi:tRNA U34 5-methylaminomethyl-2-thiouridine-forming methyltransferase MnmC
LAIAKRGLREMEARGSQGRRAKRKIISHGKQNPVMGAIY